jgi:hypothetical protein
MALLTQESMCRIHEICIVNAVVFRKSIFSCTMHMILEKHMHVSKMSRCKLFVTPLHYELILLSNYIGMNSCMHEGNSKCAFF